MTNTKPRLLLRRADKATRIRIIDNVPAHDLTIRSFLVEKQIAKSHHLPYPPDLTSCDSWHFPKVKTSTKGRRFFYVLNIQRHVARILKSIPEEEFQKYFE